MNQLHVFPDSQSLAEAAAQYSLAILRQSIEAHDVAVWVLAGGSTPLLAYRHIAAHHLDAVDWSKVTFLMGDERISSLDSPDNNWHAAWQALLQHIPQATFIRPKVDQPAEQAAREYEKQLSVLPQTKPGLPRLDLVWLGMGEDGHTLSLFPNDAPALTSDHLIIPVHDAPKSPTDRISLTLHALGGAEKAIALIGGSGKASIMQYALRPDSPLPIARAVRATGAQWFVDEPAVATLANTTS